MELERMRRVRRSVRILEEVAQDARYAARCLRASPGFAALAVIVVALAIAANIAIFALVDRLMLRPLGIAHPERLVRVFDRDTAEPDVFRAFSYPDFADLRDGAAVFDELAAFMPVLVGLGAGESPTGAGVAEPSAVAREMAQAVSARYFAALGAEPVAGRAFTAEEERPNAAVRVVVISHSLWSRLGADRGAPGRTLMVNGEPYTIVGIAPQGFGGISAILTTDLWLPLGVYGTSVGGVLGARGGDLSRRDRHELMVIGRLRAGVTREAAGREVAAIAGRLAAEHPELHRDHTFELGSQPRTTLSTRPARDTMIGAASAVMTAMAGIVLLVASLNLANMFLARGRARRAEVAIRQSLGASRARILRQLLLEGFALSSLGAAAGVVLGVWAARWVVASILAVLPFAALDLDVAVDLRAVLAALTFAVVSTLMFALGPSLALARSSLTAGLKSGAGGDTGAGGRAGGMAPRNALVVAQIALSLALVTAAGLFVRSAREARSYRPEFEVERTLLVEIDAGLASVDERRARDLWRRARERLRGHPGVEAVALASNVPFSSFSEGEPVGLTDDPQAETIDVEHYVVTSGYFGAMGLPILRGRDFDDVESESAAAPGVVIVDQPLALRLRPDGDVVGRSLRVETPRSAQPEASLQIVGVVPGVRRELFAREPEPTLYLPLGRFHRSRMIVHLRAERGGVDAAGALADGVRREIHGLDSRLPVLSTETMSAHLDQGIERWLVRTAASVFSALGAVALLLALVGVYGVKAYLVSRRTREIGIRMALGATPRDVLSWMLYEGLASTAIGVGAGILLALGVGRLLAGVLYGVGAADPVTFVAAPALLAAAALFAAYLPSRRATRLTPSAALRQE